MLHRLLRSSPSPASPNGFDHPTPTHPRRSLTPAATRLGPPEPAGPPMLRALRREDLQWLPALCELLTDAVHHGAALGLLAPLPRHAALRYWQDVFAHLGPQHQLWIATEQRGGRPEQLLGCARLALCGQSSARHRGEVLGLMVHSRARGRGIASALMSRIECTALSLGRTLLVLDTPAGTQAEAVWAHLDWQRAGEIPDFDRCAEGRLHGSARYYKRLHDPA